MKANINDNGVQSLNLNLGGIKLAVNGDMSKIISFNPDDIGFAERFYNLFSKLDEYQKKYTDKVAQLEENGELDEHGLPKNTADRFRTEREMFADLRSEFDIVFGAGTCEKAFGEMNTFDMFSEFLTAITPYVEKSRKSKISKYKKAANGKAVMK